MSPITIVSPSCYFSLIPTSTACLCSLPCTDYWCVWVRMYLIQYDKVFWLWPSLSLIACRSFPSFSRLPAGSLARRTAPAELNGFASLTGLLVFTVKLMFQKDSKDKRYFVVWFFHIVINWENNKQDFVSTWAVLALFLPDFTYFTYLYLLTSQ